MTATMSPEVTEARKIAESARQAHYLVATATDHEVSHFQSPVYVASRALLIVAIEAAYPDLSAEAIYEVWSDCSESIAYCAIIVRQRVEDERRQNEIDAHMQAICSAASVEAARDYLAALPLNMRRTLADLLYVGSAGPLAIAREARGD